MLHQCCAFSFNLNYQGGVLKRIISPQASRVSNLRITQKPGRSITRNKVCRPKIMISRSPLSASFHSTDFVLINFNISSTNPFKFSDGCLNFGWFGARPDIRLHNWQGQWTENLYKRGTHVAIILFSKSIALVSNYTSIMLWHCFLFLVWNEWLNSKRLIMDSHLQPLKISTSKLVLNLWSAFSLWLGATDVKSQ